MSDTLINLQNLKPGQRAVFDNVNPAADDEESMTVERRGAGFYGDCGKYDFTAKTAEEAHTKLSRWGYTKRVS